MGRSNRESIKALSCLYNIIEADERGYAVAGANVNNRGLKVLFKTFARQRADLNQELKGELKRWPPDLGPEAVCQR